MNKIKNKVHVVYDLFAFVIIVFMAYMLQDFFNSHSFCRFIKCFNLSYSKVF